MLKWCVWCAQILLLQGVGKKGKKYRERESRTPALSRHRAKYTSGDGKMPREGGGEGVS